MRRNKLIIAAILLQLIIALRTPAETITVGQDGGTSFSVIQQAIDAATMGDEIIVSPGTYFENVRFKGKNIVLRSTDPTSVTVVESTIIDANSSGSVVTFAGTEGPSCTLKGLTIRNGSGTPLLEIGFVGGSVLWGFFQTFGGGIYGNGTSATLQNNVIRDNFTINRMEIPSILDFWSYESRGCGVYRVNGPICGNRIENNRGDPSQQQTVDGGAAFECHGMIEKNIINNNQDGLWNCDGTVANNIMTSNTETVMVQCNGNIIKNIFMYNSTVIVGSSSGLVNGNIFMNNSGTTISHRGLVKNNLILNNQGSGLFSCNGIVQNNISSFNLRTGISRCNGVLQNNIVYGNTDDTNAAGLFQCNGTIIDNIVWNNISPQIVQIAESSTPTYSCIQDWTGGGEGNITSDPLLIDPVNGDFHLRADSPCIDTGAFVAGLLDDFDSHPRPFDGDGLGAGLTGDGSDFDIGAFEFSGYSFLIREYLLGSKDLSALQQMLFDLNTDGAVDTGDIIRDINDRPGGREGNITTDPLLNIDINDVKIEGYRLSANSPCIDTGGYVDVSSDFSETTRPLDSKSITSLDGSNFDMGAFEALITDEVIRQIILGTEDLQLAPEQIEQSDHNQDDATDVVDIVNLIGDSHEL